MDKKVMIWLVVIVVAVIVVVMIVANSMGPDFGPRTSGKSKTTSITLDKLNEGPSNNDKGLEQAFMRGRNSLAMLVKFASSSNNDKNIITKFTGSTAD